MPPAINMKGKRFGSLVVKKRLPKCHHTMGAYWLCVCDCGKTREACRLFLITRRAMSCGSKECRGKRMKVAQRNVKRTSRSREESAIYQLISLYKIGAKRKNRVWGLSYEQAKHFFEQSCHYCGAQPYQLLRIKGRKRKKPTDPYNYLHGGIDRKDPNTGYTLENSLSCCGVCNHAKTTLSYEDFLVWIDRLASFRLIQKDLKTQSLCGQNSGSDRPQPILVRGNQ